MNRPARILVLDDEAPIRSFLERALRRAGFEPVAVADGPAAIAAATSGPIDVALVDHRMAGMTGIDVYEAITAIQPELGRRWVFMSGDVLNPSLLEFAQARGIRLLAKPFTLKNVTATLEEVLAEMGLAG